MKVTIVPVDGSVSVDGKGFSPLDLSGINPTVHAVQWYDTYGEVEFKDVFAGGKITKPENQFITSFTEYEPVLALWQEAKDAAEAQPVSTGAQTL